MESQLNAELYRSLNTPCLSETMATCSLKHLKGSRKPLQSLDQNYWTLGKVRRCSRCACCGVSGEALLWGNLRLGVASGRAWWHSEGGLGCRNKHSYCP